VRIAVIADAHLPRGSRRLPRRCVEELERAELILHAGDLVTAGALEEWAQLAPVEAVRGNMDPEPGEPDRAPQGADEGDELVLDVHDGTITPELIGLGT
jgi:putative phosphoesterase